MSDEYQLRKDIDRLKLALDTIDTSNFATSKEVNQNTKKMYADLDTLNSDLLEFDTTLINLKSSLIAFNQELIDFDEDNDNFASDLSKLKDNLHSFISAVNTLSTDLTGLDSSLDGLETNVDGLGLSVNGLITAVGDNNGGLVKGLNDLTDDVFGTGGLSDSIFGTNGLASRITTAEGGLYTLVSSLDVLSGFLTEFEEELGDFETALENDPDIDTSQLDSTIVALFGIIADVKGNVDTVDGQLSDVSSSFDNVKTNLYGTKIVDGETVPKEPSDSASPTSLRGHLNTMRDETIPAVQVEIFGSDANGDPLNMSNYSDTSLLGRADTVHDDIYGENGTPTNYTKTSVKGQIHKVTEEDIPAVQTQIFGESTTQVPVTTNAFSQKTIDTTNITGTGILEFRVYPSSVVDIRTVECTGITNGDFSNDINGWETNDTTNVKKLRIGSTNTDYVRFTANPSSNAKTLSQTLNFDNINSITFYARLGQSTLAENNGNLVIFVGKKSDYDKGLYPAVETVVDDIGTAQEHIETIQEISFGTDNQGNAITDPSKATSSSLMGQVDTALTQIGDENSGLIKDISDVQDDVGTVDSDTDGSLQDQIVGLPAYFDYAYVAPSTNSTHLQAISKVSVGGTAWAVFKVSDLGRKAVRDYGSFPVELVHTDPVQGTTSASFDCGGTGTVNYRIDTTHKGIHSVKYGTIECILNVVETTSDYGFSAVSVQTMYGLTVYVFSDNINVYVTIAGTLDGSSSLPSNGSASNIGTLSNPAYAPKTAMQSPIRTSDSGSKIILNSQGEIRFVNSVSSKSYSLYCSFYYPLKRRLNPIFTLYVPTILPQGGTSQIGGILKYKPNVAVPNTKVHFFIKED